MLPILHGHHIQPIRHDNLDTTQTIHPALFITRHPQSQRRSHDNITPDQFVLSTGREDDPPCFPGELDPEPEVVVRVARKRLDVVPRVTLALLSVQQRVFDALRQGKGRDERTEVFDLVFFRGEGEEVVDEVV